MTLRTVHRALLATAIAMLLGTAAIAQDAAPHTAVPQAPAPAAERAAGSDFDTSYRPSETVSVRLQREFLDQVRWSAGIPARDSLTAAFAERSPKEIWEELVAADGLAADNVADALTAYWVLNWVTANGAYAARINNEPIQRQLRIAFSTDRGFRDMGDMQKQQLAEGYILNFLVEHAALNAAVAARDLDTLNRLAAASVMRFQQTMGVNLLALEPSAEGFRPKRASSGPAR